MRTATLSDTDLRKWCSSQSLPYHLVTLQQLNESPESAPKVCFVFTGSNSDDINKGYHNHWLFLYGNHLFDSYSYQNKYVIPSESISPVILYPRILEEFGSNTCGEYCCAFYWFASKTGVPLNNQLGKAFCDYFGFTDNRRDNDKKIVQWFNSQPNGTGQVAAPQTKE